MPNKPNEIARNPDEACDGFAVMPTNVIRDYKEQSHETIIPRYLIALHLVIPDIFVINLISKSQI